MSIRWRLTLWFSLILCAILIVSGIVVYSLLEQYLNKEVENNLVVNSARVHGTLDPAVTPSPLDYDVIHSKLPPINEFSSPGIYIQFIDSSGGVVVKTSNLGQLELPLTPELRSRGFDGHAFIATVATGDARIRVMVSPVYLVDQTLLLEVGQSLAQVESIMSQVRWVLIAVVLWAFVLASLSGAMIVKRALSPVQRISQTARSIEASLDLSRRVGYKGPMDEIGQLAETFDHMIIHLDSVFQSQNNFITNASHDLRSPLTVIKGNLDLLKTNRSEENLKESLRAIESESSRMTAIVNDLLLLTEIQSVPTFYTEQVSLREVLLTEAQRARQLTSKHEIVIEQQEDIFTRGNNLRFKQLLGNLVDNAVRYTPDGGTITLSLYRNGDYAFIKVADTGIGIAPEDIPRIFDRFYRVDKSRLRAGGGTGLGLAIVKEIACQLGGEVNVSSIPGKGSTFTVRLKL